MSKSILVILFLLLGSLTIGCSGDAVEPETVAQPQATTRATLPAPVVTVEATNTFIPYVEAQPTAMPSTTPTLTATAVPTATPAPMTAVALEPILTEGLQNPTFITHAFDERLFVLEQIGRIRIVENGQLLEQSFLDITDRVGSFSSEQGLLGLAFHPNYATADAPGYGHFYVNYTDTAGDTHISRFSVMGDDPNRADPQSEVTYLMQDQPYPNHNGGMLAFGADGYLYVGLGDGGSANDPQRAGQDLTTFLAKILRLDVDAAEGAYSIPPDNPFVGNPNALPEIWAYGLRNPWRFSFDRATHDLYIADVGQGQWEEVNFQAGGSAGGENYGWRIVEGTHCFQAETCDQSGLVPPIFEYDHSFGCAVTGGYVYRGAAFPEMVGNYFTADYCTGIIWRIMPNGEEWSADVVIDSDLIISSFGEDDAGELYALDYFAGGLYRVTPGQ